MARIHDVGYKYLFSNCTISRQLLETFVLEAWVREADFEAAETLDKSYIQEGLKEGKQEGLKEKLRIARSLLAGDMAIPDFAEITGLSEEAYPGDHSDAIDGLYAFP